MGPREIKVTEDVEVHLIALSCFPTPEGYARKAVRVLTDRMVELRYVDSISPYDGLSDTKKPILGLI